MVAPKRINLALQGGGSHGAYTWGVLDRLLEEENLLIEGISGTSAGAMNAAILVGGYNKGGRGGAKQYLEDFWRRVSEVAAFGPLHQTFIERWLSGWNLDTSPAYVYMDVLSRLYSPYDLNPLNINPLRFILDDMLDLDSLQACSVIKLFICATHVASGQARIFKCHEITTDVLLASACIPFLFQAIPIDGEEYWDGGYMGNPSIWPMLYDCDSEDVLLIQINPIYRCDTPRSASQIINRLNEIAFNSSLIAEMRAIEFVQRLIAEDRLARGKYKDVKMHLVYSPDELRDLNASSKMNASWDFFRHLHHIGRSAADLWLKTHWGSIGKESTVNIREQFLFKPPSNPQQREQQQQEKP